MSRSPMLKYSAAAANSAAGYRSISVDRALKSTAYACSVHSPLLRHSRLRAAASGQPVLDKVGRRLCQALQLRKRLQAGEFLDQGLRWVVDLQIERQRVEHHALSQNDFVARVLFSQLQHVARRREHGSRASQEKAMEARPRVPPPTAHAQSCVSTCRRPCGTPAPRRGGAWALRPAWRRAADTRCR